MNVKLPELPSTRPTRPIIAELLTTEKIFIKDMQKVSFALSQLGGKSMSLEHANMTSCLHAVSEVVQYHQFVVKKLEEDGHAITYDRLAKYYLERHQDQKSAYCNFVNSMLTAKTIYQQSNLENIIQQALDQLPEERRVTFVDWIRKPIQRASQLAMFAERMSKADSSPVLKQWYQHCVQVMRDCDDVVAEIEGPTQKDKDVKSIFLKTFKKGTKSLRLPIGNQGGR